MDAIAGTSRQSLPSQDADPPPPRRQFLVQSIAQPTQTAVLCQVSFRHSKSVNHEGPRTRRGLLRIMRPSCDLVYFAANFTKLTALFGHFAAATSVDAAPNVSGENARGHALPSHGRSSDSASHQ